MDGKIRKKKSWYGHFKDEIKFKGVFAALALGSIGVFIKAPIGWISGSVPTILLPLLLILDFVLNIIAILAMFIAAPIFMIIVLLSAFIFAFFPGKEET